MGGTMLAGFSIKNIFGKNNKNNAVNNLFSKYKIENEDEKAQAPQLDNLNIGEMMKEAVDSIFDPTSAMTEEEKQSFIEELNRKIKAGEKLTEDEMQYLRMNDPIAYAKMAKVQMQREMLKKQLENCKSKEEAHDLYIEAMSRISDDDPTKKETMAAYNNVYDEFRKSDAYEGLPATKEEAEEKDKEHKTCMDIDNEKYKHDKPVFNSNSSNMQLGVKVKNNYC